MAESLPDCLGANLPNFDFNASLGKFIIQFLEILPELPIKIPQIQARVPPPTAIEIPKIIIEEIILPAFPVAIPVTNFSIDGVGEFQIGSPDISFPDLPELIPTPELIFPQVLIDFIVGLIKIVAKLPEILITPPDSPIDAIAIIVSGAITIPDVIISVRDEPFKITFSRCLAKQIAGKIGLA